MKKYIFLLCSLVAIAQIQAQKPSIPLPKPTLGLHSGLVWGNFKFPEKAIYAQGELDSYAELMFGGYAQLYLTPKFFLQPEFSTFRRSVRSDVEFKYVVELLGQTVRYRVNGEQTVFDAALLGYYRFRDGKIQPFAGAGLSIGFHGEKNVFQETNPQGASWKRSDIETRESDTGLLLGAGCAFALGKNLRLLAEARYGVAASNWKTFENEIQKISFTTNVTLSRVIGRIGVGWQF